MRTLFLVILCLIAAPILSAEESDASDTVFPQKLTAGELRLYCAASAMSATGLQRRRYCDGFLSGVEESVRVLGLISSREAPLSLCVPANVSARQLRAVFVKNSAAIKPPKDKPAAMFAIEVLEKSFPCR